MNQGVKRFAVLVLVYITLAWSAVLAWGWLPRSYNCIRDWVSQSVITCDLFIPLHIALAFGFTISAIGIVLGVLGVDWLDSPQESPL